MGTTALRSLESANRSAEPDELTLPSTHSSLLRGILRKGGTPERSLSFHSLQRCYGCYRKDMRLFIALLSLSFVFAACKARTPVPALPEVAKATPAPSATPVPEPNNLKSQVIVLCYHRFDDNPKDSLAIRPADFEAQMQALKDSGIIVISMEDFLAWRRGKKGIPEKAAIISIDDGYLSGYKVAWPILKKFGYPFTMFIYTDYVKGGPKSGGQSIPLDRESCRADSSHQNANDLGAAQRRRLHSRVGRRARNVTHDVAQSRSRPNRRAVAAEGIAQVLGRQRLQDALPGS